MVSGIAHPEMPKQITLKIRKSFACFWLKNLSAVSKPRKPIYLLSKHCATKRPLVSSQAIFIKKVALDHPTT